MTEQTLKYLLAMLTDEKMMIPAVLSAIHTNAVEEISHALKEGEQQGDSVVKHPKAEERG